VLMARAPLTNRVEVLTGHSWANVIDGAVEREPDQIKKYKTENPGSIMYALIMKSCYKLLTGLEHPWRSAVLYTLTGILLSLAISLLTIIMVWISNTPFFDVGEFFAEVVEQIIVFRLSLMLVLIGLIISWAILKRNTSTTIACALLIKIITGSYMTALITSMISRFMVVSGWFGDWTDNLPWSSIYPTIALAFTLLLWGGTWFGVLILRNHVKALARAENREHFDIYDRLRQFFQRKVEKPSN